jgi:hypothetical protein
VLVGGWEGGGAKLLSAAGCYSINIYNAGDSPVLDNRTYSITPPIRSTAIGSETTIPGALLAIRRHIAGLAINLLRVYQTADHGYLVKITF